MAIQFLGSDILFNDGKIAHHEDCCCGVCEGECAEQYQLILSDVDEVGCDSCLELNKSYILDWHDLGAISFPNAPCEPASACQWQLEFAPFTLCSYPLGAGTDTKDRIHLFLRLSRLTATTWDASAIINVSKSGVPVSSDNNTWWRKTITSTPCPTSFDLLPADVCDFEAQRACDFTAATLSFAAL